ncbi:hypothetical protein [Enterobacter cloacae]|uniref:hypothetical protein n=1 Tax=Enterobacter cloacae TaxID=550 RepID=UPI0021D27043|nr:hypothetical protein [Enterobacter cloacae]MCU6301569.1 hypothetical protein [Enterobacter cloacae]
MSNKYEDLVKNARMNADCGEHMSPAEVTTLLNVVETTFAALAAENTGLKAALRPSDIPSELTDAFGDTAVIEHDSTGDNQGHSVSWSWVGNQEEVIKSVLLAVDKGIETPATDAFLAEVRASALPVEIAEIIDSGDLEAILFASGYAEAEKYRMALYNFRTSRKGVQS